VAAEQLRAVRLPTFTNHRSERIDKCEEVAVRVQPEVIGLEIVERVPIETKPALTDAGTARCARELIQPAGTDGQRSRRAAPDSPAKGGGR
jgi:hypothetical protein